jgi:hypothetical protein
MEVITMDTMNEMRKAVYTKEVLLDIINKYLTQIERSAEEHPKVVLDDIKVSMEYVLEVNGYKRRK